MILFKKIILSFLLLFTIHISLAQTHNSYYQGIVDNCTLASVNTHLNEFVAHGVKSVGTTELNDAKNWLKNKYLSYGYTDIVEDTFTVGANTTTNIVVTKVGLVYPNTYVIVDGHYDTINGVGANDNGSGTTLILEIAKQLATVPTEYSIKFINFSAEELGLLGSNNYVNNTVIPQNLDIRLVFNIDQVGGVNGMTNDTIVCERDTSNPPENNAASNTITNELTTCIGLYSSLNTEISFAYSSDYIPFENNGEVITGLYEKNETTHSHSATDIIANMDVNYLYEVIKGSTGAVLHFAVANQALGIDDNLNNLNNLNQVVFYPNPAKGFIRVDTGGLNLKKSIIQLTDLSGKVIISESNINIEGIYDIALDNVSSGIYVLELMNDGIKKSNKIVIE